MQKLFKNKSNRIFNLLLIVFLFVSCGKGTTEFPVELEIEFLPHFLDYLEQYDEYPFYAARYQGDYAFDEYLKTGEYPELKYETAAHDTYACSCFFAGGESAIYGRNFDWYENPAILLFTDPQDGYRSVSMVDISYLGYDREFTPMDDPEGLVQTPYYPFDGMNEHGLVVGMMAVGHGEGGSDEGKVTLGSLEVIRLMLDYAKDVPEALRLIENYNVDFGSVPVHYLVSDTSGNSVIIEYLGDEIVVTETQNQYQVSTNFIIAEVQPIGANSHSGRYNTLVSALHDSNEVVDVKVAMDLLEDVSQSGGETATRWSVVYDMENLEVHIAIDRIYGNVYSFSLE